MICIKMFPREMQFKCEMSGKYFGLKNNFINHQEIHTLEKPLGCDKGISLKVSFVIIPPHGSTQQGETFSISQKCYITYYHILNKIRKIYNIETNEFSSQIG